MSGGLRVPVGVTGAGGGGEASEGLPARSLRSKVGDKTWSLCQSFHTGPSRHKAARWKTGRPSYICIQINKD